MTNLKINYLMYMCFISGKIIANNPPASKHLHISNNINNNRKNSLESINSNKKKTSPFKSSIGNINPFIFIGKNIKFKWLLLAILRPFLETIIFISCIFGGLYYGVKSVLVKTQKPLVFAEIMQAVIGDALMEPLLKKPLDLYLRPELLYYKPEEIKTLHGTIIETLEKSRNLIRVSSYENLNLITDLLLKIIASAKQMKDYLDKTKTSIHTPVGIQLQKDHQKTIFVNSMQALEELKFIVHEFTKILKHLPPPLIVNIVNLLSYLTPTSQMVLKMLFQWENLIYVEQAIMNLIERQKNNYHAYRLSYSLSTKRVEFVHIPYPNTIQALFDRQFYHEVLEKLIPIALIEFSKSFPKYYQSYISNITTAVRGIIISFVKQAAPIFLASSQDIDAMTSAASRKKDDPEDMYKNSSIVNIALLAQINQNIKDRDDKFMQLLIRGYWTNEGLPLEESTYVNLMPLEDSVHISTEMHSLSPLLKSIEEFYTYLENTKSDFLQAILNIIWDFWNKNIGRRTIVNMDMFEWSSLKRLLEVYRKDNNKNSGKEAVEKLDVITNLILLEMDKKIFTTGEENEKTKKAFTIIKQVCTIILKPQEKKTIFENIFKEYILELSNDTRKDKIFTIYISKFVEGNKKVDEIFESLSQIGEPVALMHNNSASIKSLIKYILTASILQDLAFGAYGEKEIEDILQGKSRQTIAIKLQEAEKLSPEKIYHHLIMLFNNKNMDEVINRYLPDLYNSLLFKTEGEFFKVFIRTVGSILNKSLENYDNNDTYEKFDKKLEASNNFKNILKIISVICHENSLKDENIKNLSSKIVDSILDNEPGKDYVNYKDPVKLFMDIIKFSQLQLPPLIIALTKKFKSYFLYTPKDEKDKLHKEISFKAFTLEEIIHLLMPILTDQLENFSLIFEKTILEILELKFQLPIKNNNHNFKKHMEGFLVALKDYLNRINYKESFKEIKNQLLIYISNDDNLIEIIKDIINMIGKDTIKIMDYELNVKSIINSISKPMINRFFVRLQEKSSLNLWDIEDLLYVLGKEVLKTTWGKANVSSSGQETLIVKINYNGGNYNLNGNEGLQTVVETANRIGKHFKKFTKEMNAIPKKPLGLVKNNSHILKTQEIPRLPRRTKSHKLQPRSQMQEYQVIKNSTIQKLQVIEVVGEVQKKNDIQIIEEVMEIVQSPGNLHRQEVLRLFVDESLEAIGEENFLKEFSSLIQMNIINLINMVLNHYGYNTSAENIQTLLKYSIEYIKTNKNIINNLQIENASNPIPNTVANQLAVTTHFLRNARNMSMSERLKALGQALGCIYLLANTNNQAVAPSRFIQRQILLAILGEGYEGLVGLLEIEEGHLLSITLENQKLVADEIIRNNKKLPLMGRMKLFSSYVVALNAAINLIERNGYEAPIVNNSAIKILATYTLGPNLQPITAIIAGVVVMATPITIFTAATTLAIQTGNFNSTFSKVVGVVGLGGVCLMSVYPIIGLLGWQGVVLDLALGVATGSLNFSSMRNYYRTFIGKYLQNRQFLPLAIMNSAEVVSDAAFELVIVPETLVSMLAPVAIGVSYALGIASLPVSLFIVTTSFTINYLSTSFGENLLPSVPSERAIENNPLPSSVSLSVPFIANEAVQNEIAINSQAIRFQPPSIGATSRILAIMIPVMSQIRQAGNFISLPLLKSYEYISSSYKFSIERFTNFRRVQVVSVNNIERSLMIPVNSLQLERVQEVHNISQEQEEEENYAIIEEEIPESIDGAIEPAVSLIREEVIREEELSIVSLGPQMSFWQRSLGTAKSILSKSSQVLTWVPKKIIESISQVGQLPLLELS